MSVAEEQREERDFQNSTALIQHHNSRSLRWQEERRQRGLAPEVEDAHGRGERRVNRGANPGESGGTTEILKEGTATRLYCF